MYMNASWGNPVSKNVSTDEARSSHSHATLITDTQLMIFTTVYLFVFHTDACKESSWETHSDMVSCTEDVTFYCRGMFPKPSPVCGIYNDITGKYTNFLHLLRVCSLS